LIFDEKNKKEKKVKVPKKLKNTIKSKSLPQCFPQDLMFLS